MKIAELTNKEVVIWGSGREAASVINAIRRLDVVPTSVRVLDEQRPSEPTLEGVAILPFSTAALDNADVIVRSPGVSKYRPELAGRAVTTATNLWFAEPHKRIIAITGTKGKSTTSSLTKHILCELGADARLAGNIGYSPLDQIGESEPDYWVVEMSSFQTSDMEGWVDVAALTSFSPEHLDWHGSEANYLHDKLRLFQHAEKTVINGENARAREIAAQIPNAIFAQQGRFLDAKPRLFGPHNRELIALATTILEVVGIDIEGKSETIRTAIESFQPLAHRLEPIAEFGGRVWINDSLSTTVTSTIAAIRAFAAQPTTLLVGGYDRGISYAPLTPVLREHTNVVVVTMPDCGDRIAESVPKTTQLMRSEGLEDAVRIANEITPKGGVVLLSPGAASFGQFRDYVERGKRFCEYVNALQERDSER